MLNTPFEGNKLTGDRARYQRNYELALKLPDIFVRGPTFSWIYAAFRAMAEANEPSFPSTIRIPTLTIIGALDRVVSVTAVERLVAGLRAGGKVVIAGAEHELPMERDIIREQMFAAFDAFVPWVATSRRALPAPVRAAAGRRWRRCVRLRPPSHPPSL